MTQSGCDEVHRMAAEMLTTPTKNKKKLPFSNWCVKVFVPQCTCTLFVYNVINSDCDPGAPNKRLRNYKMHVHHDYLQLKPLRNISNNKQVDVKTNLSSSKRHLAMVISVECGKLLKKVI